MKKNVFLNATAIIAIANILGLGSLSAAGTQEWSRYGNQGYYTPDNRSSGYSSYSQDRAAPSYSSWGASNTDADNDDDDNNNLPPATSQRSRDLDLSNRVQSILDKGNYRNVDAEVRGGAVILRGKIQTAQDRGELQNKLQRIPGLSRIDNRLEVMADRRWGDSFSSRNTTANQAQADIAAADQAIKNEVQSSLRGSFFTKGYPNVRAEVDNGTVILTGTIDSQKSLSDLREKINKIDGVRNIASQLRVEQND